MPAVAMPEHGQPCSVRSSFTGRAVEGWVKLHYRCEVLPGTGVDDGQKRFIRPGPPLPFTLRQKTARLQQPRETRTLLSSGKVAIINRESTRNCWRNTRWHHRHERLPKGRNSCGQSGGDLNKAQRNGRRIRGHFGPEAFTSNSPIKDGGTGSM